MLGPLLWTWICPVVSEQHILWPSLDPHSTVGSGGEPRTVAERSQPIQSARYFLLIRCHGTVHQRPRLIRQPAQN
ncbi:unnamed protein product [Callosobruchus maculatus]|uniref:Secreted protein n=1 Tax=Callosobruchus maculatus TaxID=64391 RepID=A0A653CD45_CALMS|nr:unnamed protein product [Callosobruchus maculatus]